MSIKTATLYCNRKECVVPCDISRETISDMFKIPNPELVNLMLETISSDCHGIYHLSPGTEYIVLRTEATIRYKNILIPVGCNIKKKNISNFFDFKRFRLYHYNSAVYPDKHGEYHLHPRWEYHIKKWPYLF